MSGYFDGVWGYHRTWNTDSKWGADRLVWYANMLQSNNLNYVQTTNSIWSASQSMLSADTMLVPIDRSSFNNTEPDYSLMAEKISRSFRKRTILSLELRRILKDARISSSNSSCIKSSPSGSSTRAKRLRPTCLGKILLIESLGMRRIRTAIGRDIAPRPSEIAHWILLRRVADRGLPPKETMRTCPIMVIRLMAMKYQFLCRPSKTLSLLSRRRLLCQM